MGALFTLFASRTERQTPKSTLEQVAMFTWPACQRLPQLIVPKGLYFSATYSLLWAG